MNKQKIIVRELKVFIDVKWQRNKISELQIEEQKCSKQEAKEKTKTNNNNNNKTKTSMSRNYGTVPK